MWTLRGFLSQEKKFLALMLSKVKEHVCGVHVWGMSDAEARAVTAFASSQMMPMLEYMMLKMRLSR